MVQRNANGGNATLLDDPLADASRRPAGWESEARPPRSARRLPDPETDEEPFLRARRRVPVRRGLLPAWAKSRWGKLAFAALVFAVLGAATALALAVRHFLTTDPRFRIASAASIQTMGNSQLTRGDLLQVFGADVGRNLFLVPLARRRAALEQIPWVESATVMRLLPNQLRVAVVERTPIAFVQIHGRIQLADANGVILDMTPQEMAAKHYSFPVVSGIDPADPLSVRAARMHLYQQFLAALDSTGQHFSAQLSEVNLSDPEDVRATVPSAGTDLVLDFGQQDFLARWQNYQAHIAQWRQQYPQLAAVDLRYQREVVLKMAGDPDIDGTPKMPATPAASAPAAAAKPAPHRAPAARHTTRHRTPARAQAKAKKHPARHAGATRRPA